MTHLISQLFYDNEDFLRFLDKARAAGIDVPIEAGIMPVMNAKSVLNMSNKCQSKVPEKLGIMLDKWGGDKALLKEAGIATHPSRSANWWRGASTACTCTR